MDCTAVSLNRLFIDEFCFVDLQMFFPPDHPEKCTAHANCIVPPESDKHKKDHFFLIGKIQRKDRPNDNPSDHVLSNAIQLYNNLGFKTIDGPLGETGHFACEIRMVKDLS